ncbi:MAG: hypothetical protein KDK99_06010 [Verrucomicrobiales bacterium]|nr:hypothetical protein [Verrucomicrobiales bacterium]
MSIPISLISPAFQILFGTAEARLSTESMPARLDLPLPLLAGRANESVGLAPEALSQQGDFTLARSRGQLAGAALMDASGRLEDVTERVFRQLLEVTSGLHLYRVWSYLPRINAVQGGLERYRQFNIGRWAAFESHFGVDLRAYLPAASGVGADGDHLVILFEAGEAKPTYFENPSQIPAYHYPADYGPRPPGFARGVRVERDEGAKVYLSGTASIEGHRSVGGGDWAQQFQTTLRHIRTMLGRMGVTSALRPDQWERSGIRQAQFKCYLREPECLPLITEWLEEACGTTQHVTFLQSDICRAELDIEIEATIETMPSGPEA